MKDTCDSTGACNFERKQKDEWASHFDPYISPLLLFLLLISLLSSLTSSGMFYGASFKFMIILLQQSALDPHIRYLLYSLFLHQFRMSLNYHYRKTQTCNSLRNIDTFSSINRSGEAVSSGWLCPPWSFRTPDSPCWAAQLSPDSWNHLHGWDELPQSQGLRQWKAQENLHEACLAPLDQKQKLYASFLFMSQWWKFSHMATPN